MSDWMLGSGFDTSMEGDVSKSNNRLWKPKGSEKKILFLTSGRNAPVVWEHGYQSGGTWGHFLTCLSQAKMVCPMCLWSDANKGKYRRSKVMFFTVLDIDGYTAKDGTKKTNIPRLMGCKKDVVDIIKRKWLSRMEAGGDLRGSIFKVYRPNSDKSASVGEDFEFVSTVDLTVPPYSEFKEFDYEKEFALEPDRMRDVVERLRVEGTEASSYFSDKVATPDSVKY